MVLQKQVVQQKTTQSTAVRKAYLVLKGDILNCLGNGWWGMVRVWLKWGDVVLGTSIFVEGFYGKTFFWWPKQGGDGHYTGIESVLFANRLHSQKWNLETLVFCFSESWQKNCSIQRYSQAPLFRRTLWAQEGGVTPNGLGSLVATMMLPPGRPCMPMGQMPGPGLPGLAPMTPGMPIPGLPSMPMPNMQPPGMPTLPGPPTGPCGMNMPQPMGNVNPGLMPPCGGCNTLPPQRPMMPMPMDTSMPRPMGNVIPPPAPMRPQMIPAPQQPFNPSLPPRPPSLPQQLAQLQAAGQEGQRHAPAPPAPFQGDRKPQLFMLIAQLAPHVKELLDISCSKAIGVSFPDRGIVTSNIEIFVDVSAFFAGFSI